MSKVFGVSAGGTEPRASVILLFVCSGGAWHAEQPSRVKTCCPVRAASRKDSDWSAVPANRCTWQARKALRRAASPRLGGHRGEAAFTNRTQRAPLYSRAQRTS